MQSLVAARGITVSFDGIDVLKNASIDLLAGEIHAIVGENGAGKSTLAKCLAGVYRPRLGQILVQGREQRFNGPRDALEQGIALIHQEPLTFPHLSVAENIFAGNLPKKNGFINWNQVQIKASRILDEFGVQLDLNSPVGGLSVAMQQMVELASAMAHQPQILIFDETTAPLTPAESKALFAVMNQLKSKGCAIGFVSHHLNEIFEIADRVSVLRDGEKIKECAVGELDEPKLIQLMVGRELSSEKYEQRANSASQPALRVENLTAVGVENVSFHVGQGEIVGMAGLIGAGRTEVAQTLFGIRPLKGGKVTLGGKVYKICSPKKCIQDGLCLVPEDRQHDGLAVEHSVEVNATSSFISRLKGWQLIMPARMAEKCDTACKSLGVVCRSWRQPVKELSGGNQQKVSIANRLMTQAKVLLLDEPTRGVDVGAKHEVHRIIKGLADQGSAILLISSDLQEILTLSDRILVMRKGKVAAELSAAEATQELILSAAAGEVRS